MQDRLRKQILMFKNWGLHQLRTHTAYRHGSMTGLAIVFENPSSSGRDPLERPFGHRFLREQLRLPEFTVERRQLIRCTRVIPRRQIPYEQVLLILGYLRTPMFHFPDRGLPSRARQPLLRDEISAVTDGTARDNQSLCTLRRRGTDHAQSLLLCCCHASQAHEADHQAQDPAVSADPPV